MNTNTQIQTRPDAEKSIEFIPYGAADKIKLSVKIIQNIVAVPTRSGKTCSERDALRFLMLCQAQRLNPFAGDAYLVGYDGKDGATFSLIASHQSFLKRAETCPDFEGMESGIIILTDADAGATTEREGDFHLENETVVGGWAKVYRNGRKPVYRRIRMGRFNKGFAQWQVDAAGMIVKCAEADALRSTFPTLLGGLYMQGEQDGAAGRIVAELATTRPIFEAPARITDAAPPPPSVDDSEGSDLGPQTAPPPRAASPVTAPPLTYTPRKPRNPTPAPTPPPPAAEPQQPAGPLAEATEQALGTEARAQVFTILHGAGVKFDDFRDWLRTTGRHPDPSTFAEFEDVPMNICTALLEDYEARGSKSALAKCIQIYGAKGGES